MNIADLGERFAIPGHLEFDEHQGLARAQVGLPAAAATVYLHGAHVTHWSPAGTGPVLFLSEQSEFADGKAIRGGVPICWPWFGSRSDSKPGPSHGFARIQEWELAFTALIPGESGDRMHLTFTLAPSELSRSLGFDNFRVAYEVVVGATLTLKLTVANLAAAPLRFEEALHAYFVVDDVRHASLSGLESATYLDKTDGTRAKTTPDGPLRFTSETDRVFPANTAPITIHDAGNRRVVTIQKSHSATTVVWNPWSGLADLAGDAWPRFVCVEAANAGANAITLNGGETHTVSAVISVAPETCQE